MYVLDISDVYTELEIKAVLKIGINAMLLKECDEEEIVEAIEVSVKGERFFCGTVLDILSGDKSKVPFSCEPISLSSRELEIIQLIAKGLTSKEMSEKLFLSHHTINTHRKNILKKLEVKGTPELINYAFAMGMV
jgi:DNA-binding NarL/FixJ family response regulator